MFLKEKEDPVNPNLETTAEISIGKEINMVNKEDFNHLDLVIEAKNNRLKSEFFYIYNYEEFNNCSLLKPNFDIFTKEGGITHTSTRYVIHYLTKELKKRFKEIDRSSKSGRNTLYDVFKPSLGQFDDTDIANANVFVKSMFPFEGCSYTGEKLESIINKVDWITLILGLRLIWSLLPGAIIPWDSYNKFKEAEKRSNYSNFQSFYQMLPIFLPSHNHCCVLFEFLEIFIAIFADDYFVDLNVSTDLIFTAGQICFNRDEFDATTTSQNDDDLNELQKFYYKRGSAFYHLFIAYLRSLSKEPNFEYQVLLDPFKIDVYPPKPYEPLTQKALTLTVPSDPDLATTNYFKLISNAANATSRIYSSNHNFTKFENKFLDKFEVNPHKIIEHFFSKSSKNYLLKFDQNLDFENFKVNKDVSDLRKNLKNGTLFDNKELISTFINDFSRYGFESQRDNGNNSETFIADTINFNFNSNLETVDNLPVRVSKLEISEWFINAWKYETFLGYLQNTVVLKLTKTIGDCDWLIITSHDKVSSTNRYLTPPGSAEVEIDLQKEAELNSINLKVEEPVTTKRKSLLPPLSTISKINTNKPIGSSTPCSSISSSSTPKYQRKSPPRSDLKRISFPSAPKNIESFEKDSAAPAKEEKPVKVLSPQKRDIKKSHQVDQASIKPLPAPIIPNQRITTPPRAADSSTNPPALFKDSLASDSLTADQISLVTSKIDFTSPKNVKYISPRNSKSGSPKNIKGLVLSEETIKSGSSSTISSKKSTLSGDLADHYNITPPTVTAPKLQSPVKTKKTTLKEQVVMAGPNGSSLSEVSPRVNSSFKSQGVLQVPVPYFVHPKSHPKPISKSPRPHPYQQFKNSPPIEQPGTFRNQPNDRNSDQPFGSTSAIVFVANQDTPVTDEFRFDQRNNQNNLEKQINLEKELEKQEKSSDKLFEKPIEPPATSVFQTPPSPVLNESSSSVSNLTGRKLSIKTNGAKPHVSSKASPISQALPKLFKKKSLPQMTNSESSKSLAFINDGTRPAAEPEIERGYSPTPPLSKKKSTKSLKSERITSPTLEEPIIEQVPEMVDTPKAFNNESFPYSTPLENPPSARKSFESDTSSALNNQFDSTDNLSDTTQDTTKNTISISDSKVISNLNGLLSEIAESIDHFEHFESDRYFSTEDVSKNTSPLRTSE